MLRVNRDRERGARTLFLAGLMDWLGAEPPTFDAIANARLLDVGHLHVRAIEHGDSQIIGLRPLELDGLTVPDTSPSYWGYAYAPRRAESLLLRGDSAPAFERREFRSPLTKDMLRPFVARMGVVQFQGPLTDVEFQTLAEWVRAYPQVTLRAYGHYRTPLDLEFLRFFPFLTRFAVDAAYNSLESLAGLRHLTTNLDSLTIGSTKRPLDLAILERFPGLKSLYLEGQQKGIGVLSRLAALEELTLRSVTLPDLSPLLPLDKLLALDIKLGGTRDLALLPRIGRLRYVELWMIKGLTDISVASKLPHLRYLFLQALRNVEQLPDLSNAMELRRVHLETMNGIHDLRPIARAPSLQELVLVDMRHLRPDDLRPFVGHPTLRAARVGLGSIKKNDVARQLLGLPDTDELKVGWREV